LKKIFKIFSSFLFLSVFLCLFCMLPSCNSSPVESDNDPFWNISTPEQENVDGKILENYFADVRSGKYNEIHSLLVIRHGSIIKEEYYYGYNVNTLHPIYSDTKSVTSCLMGIAFDQGKLKDLRKQLLSFFPEYSSFSYSDVNKSLITLEDVLMMKAGFDWNEGAYPYGDQKNPVSGLSQSSDWIKFMLDTPMKDRPGSKFAYNSGCSMLLSGILRNTLNQQAHDYAKNVLFNPLNITNYIWETGSQGIANTGWGLHLRPRDMAKFGLLYLYEGKWQDKQIVSKEWVQKSTSRMTLLTNGYRYGYQWWMMPLSKDSTSNYVNDIKIAWGYGGQFIFVIPSLDMVVVSTAGDYNSQYEGAINLIQDMLTKSVKSF
jgi:CubicO group peptidase (beta-lactamase class C family)